MSERLESGTVLDPSFSRIEELRSQSHIAQKSRRDKLRVQHQQLHNPMPLYDPSVLSSEMLTFVTGNEVFLAQKEDRTAFHNQQIPIPFKEDGGVVHNENTDDLILNYGGSSSSYVTQNPLLANLLNLKQTNFPSPCSSQLLMNPNFSDPQNPPSQSSLTVIPDSNHGTHKHFGEVPLPLNFNGFSPNPLENQPLYTSHQVPQSLSNFNSFRFSNVSDGSFNDGIEFKQEPLSLNHDSTGQGLSLSLSFQNPPQELNLQQYDTRFECPSGSGIFNVGQDGKAGKTDDIYNRQLIESGYCSYPRDGNSDRNGGKGCGNIVHGVRGSSSSSEIQKSLVPLGPFTGYATVLKSSRFLKPAQQLLDGFCNVGHGVPVEMLKQQPQDNTLREGGSGGSGSCIDTSTRVSTSVTNMEETQNDCGLDDPRSSGGDRSEHQKKKMRLMSMLDEVCRRYRHYYEQVQVVVTSFESVAGLRTAAPYTTLALKSMSRHFLYLKNAIAGQLRSIRKSLGEDCQNKEEMPRMRPVDHQRGSPRSGLLGQQHVWRPQRGLPERAVAVLRSWLFEHFLHPYPNDTDKQMLAKQTGLSRNQVSNWFINARVRLWKPMVEEMHMLETREPSSACAMDLNNSSKKPDTLSEEDINNRRNQEAKMTIDVLPDKQQQQQQQNHDQTMKRSRSDLAHMISREESMNFSYENLAPPDSHVGVRIGTIGSNIGGGVSLTLGLHHNGVHEKYHHNNNGVFLSTSEMGPSMPIEVAHHLSSLQQHNNNNSQAFGIGGFVEHQQNMQLRKQMGCQLFHDFVG